MKLLQGGQAVRRIEILNDPALQVDCPICEEKRGLRCHVQPGVAHFDSHFERKELAQEKMIQRVVESKEVSILAARDREKNWH